MKRYKSIFKESIKDNDDDLQKIIDFLNETIPDSPPSSAYEEGSDSYYYYASFLLEPENKKNKIDQSLIEEWQDLVNTDQKLFVKLVSENIPNWKKFAQLIVDYGY
jgi:hypothetical protein